MAKMGLEVALIGIDGSGKSSAGKAISTSLSDVLVIKITNYEYNGLVLSNLGRGMDHLSGLGDIKDSKFIAGVGYLGCLMLSPVARTLNRDRIIVWERHPRYDAEAYAGIYLEALGKAGQALDAMLKKGIKLFPEPDRIIYLKTPVPTALERISRNHEMQIHEKSDRALEMIAEYFDYVVEMAYKAGHPEVSEIYTENRGVDDVNSEVVGLLGTMAGKLPKQKQDPVQIGEENR